MSAVNSTTFANKRPPAEAVDPVNQLGYTTFVGVGSGGGVVGNFAETVFTSGTLNATKAINKGFIRKTQGMDIASGNSLTIRIREDDINGTILNSTTYNPTNFIVDLSITITNQPVGNRTYVWTLQLNTPTPGDFYRFHSPSSIPAPGASSSLAYIVDFDGAKNTNIISG